DWAHGPDHLPPHATLTRRRTRRFPSRRAVANLLPTTQRVAGTRRHAAGRSAGRDGRGSRRSGYSYVLRRAPFARDSGIPEEARDHPPASTGALRPWTRVSRT